MRKRPNIFSALLATASGPAERRGLRSSKLLADVTCQFETVGHLAAYLRYRPIFEGVVGAAAVGWVAGAATPTSASVDTSAAVGGAAMGGGVTAG